MFGLPPGDSLREVVVELTQDHVRTVGGLLGTEPPLLRLLQVAIAADTSGASGGAGRSKNSAPLDVTALALWEEIADVINRNWPGRADPTKQHHHLIDRLTWWTRTVVGGPDEHHLLEFALYWRKQIRDLLDPPRRIPLRGVPCRACETTWIKEVQHGETTNTPALLAQIGEDQPHGMLIICRSCGEELSGLGLQLSAAL